MSRDERRDTPLPNTDPATIAARAIRLYAAYLEEGLPEMRARAAAIGRSKDRHEAK